MRVEDAFRAAEVEHHAASAQARGMVNLRR
jgi:hypothetical protein